MQVISITGTNQYRLEVMVMSKEPRPQPLYGQLVTELKGLIQANLKPDDQLPSEREIVKRYAVSRNTVRQALNELEELGYVYRQAGRGTFVSSVLTQPARLGENYSFTEQMRILGRTPQTIVLSFDRMPVDNFFADRLHLAYGEQMIKLKRLRIADNVPMMLERTYLPADKFPAMTGDMLNQAPLYQLMAEHYNEAFHFADEAIVASIVANRDTAILGVARTAPCLNLTRTTYDQHNQAIEYTNSVARSDQFVYRIRYTRHF